MIHSTVEKETEAEPITHTLKRTILYNQMVFKNSHKNLRNVLLYFSYLLTYIIKILLIVVINVTVELETTIYYNGVS